MEAAAGWSDDVIERGCVTLAPLDAGLETSMAATIKLFYELQTNRRTSSSNYGDLGDQMYDAVINAALSIIDLGNDIAWNAIAVQRDHC